MSSDLRDAGQGRLKAKQNLSLAQAAPLYEQVKRQISEMILVGTWPPGTLLPTEPVLAERMGVALGTVRRALSELNAEGLIARRRRNGTVVTGRMPHHSLSRCFQYFRLHGPNDAFVRSSAKILDYQQRSASQSEAAALDLDPGSPVHDIHRVRSVDQKPIMHDRIVLSVKLAPGISTATEIPELLYLYLLEKSGVRISAIREKISADLSSDVDVSVFNRAGSFPILKIDEIAFDQQGRPVLTSLHRAITEGFHYINEVK